MSTILFYIYEGMADSEVSPLLHRLRNAGCRILAISEDTAPITAQSGQRYWPDLRIQDAPTDAEALIIPGDPIRNDQNAILPLCRAMASQGKLITAICFGPRFLGRIKESDGDPLTLNEYQRLAMTTLNPALSKKDVLINGVMGLCGESGEAIDLVKKHLAQGHELNREAIIKELGDVAWYLAETAHALDVSLEEVCQRNLNKLRRRYPDGFSTVDSLRRTDEESGKP